VPATSVGWRVCFGNDESKVQQIQMQSFKTLARRRRKAVQEKNFATVAESLTPD
jgi:hypothetical protein